MIVVRDKVGGGERKGRERGILEKKSERRVEKCS
jgi:hypothetical protein